MLEAIVIFALVVAVAVFVTLWRLSRSEIIGVLKEKRAADDKCAAALAARDAAVERRDFMAKKFDPVLESMLTLRERHSDALNELSEETAVHKQRAHTLSLIIEKLLPDTNISEPRRQMILKQIQPEAMLAEYAKMVGASDGEAERHADKA